MIATLRGNILEIEEEGIIVEVGGVGYRVFVPLRSLTGQYNNGDSIFLYTYLIVRDDAWNLFGFLTKDEETLFGALINVSGIGGKTALAMLNQLSPATIVGAIITGDSLPFEQISGIGKKTAQRIVLELKDKVEKLGVSPVADYSTGGIITAKKADGDAVAALTQLGYSGAEAKKAVVKVIQEDVASSTEDIIRKALRLLSKF